MSDFLFDITVTKPTLSLSRPPADPKAAVFEVRVFGTPAPQGSKTGIPIYKGKGGAKVFTGKVAMVESSKKVKPWRDSVRVDALLERGVAAPIDQAVMADMIFTFRRPQSHYRTGRNAHLLRDGAPVQPDGYPDLDKLARSTGDALTDAGVLKDDGRIAEYGRLAKVWANEDPDSLDAPGAVIRIYLIGATA